MSREDCQLEKLYLKPGELLIIDEPMIVTTVLGSCISVTMFHQQTGTAAICHAMMPGGRDSISFKYVDASIHQMVKYFLHRKVQLEKIQVKLFGGADMFKSIVSEIPKLTVGRQNISAAIHCLKEYGLVPTASDVGGWKGRKLIFKTDTGIVLLKKQSDNDW
jgi:chemotaxis protein CheD